MEPVLFKNGYLFTRLGTFRKGALLIHGDRIGHVYNEPPPDQQDRIEEIDLGSKYVLPGFVDAHFHISSLALKSLRCDLGGAESAEEAIELLAEWPGRGDEAVLVGVDWDESGWRDRRFPTREMLERLEARRPVLMRRICGHVGVVNSAFAQLLKAEGVTVDGETGVIEEDAVYSAGRMSLPNDASIVQSFNGAVSELHRLGITGIHDIIEADRFELYVEGIRRAKNPIRIKGFITTTPGKIEHFRRIAGTMDKGFFEIKGVKLFLDGSIGGWTAALNEPYEDSPKKGDLLLTEDKLKRILDECLEHNVGCAIHAIGDRALRKALQLLVTYPPDTHGLRIEHAEIIGLEELRLLEKAPVYIVMQPNFIRNWGVPGGLYETKLGKERLKLCNRFRTLHDSHIGYCFSSDVMPPGPFYGLKGAVRHPIPEERLTPGEALLYYTMWAPKLSGSPEGHGVLEEGSPADFIILSGNPLVEDPDQLEILKTFVAGRCVHEAGTNKVDSAH
jgi:predicted amidohydrolase YtcJ